MATMLVEYIEHMQELVDNFVATLDGLSSEALDWSPGPELNSLAVLAAHTVGATRYWLGDVVAREPSGRIRELEFQTKAADGTELRQRFGSVMAYAQKTVSTLTMADLEDVRFAMRQNRDVSVTYALTHALTHLAEHLAHAQMTRQLWEQQGRHAPTAAKS